MTSSAKKIGTISFSAAFMVLGFAMIVVALGRGGGPLSIGVVLGALFVLLAVFRLYLALHSPPERPDEGELGE